MGTTSKQGRTAAIAALASENPLTRCHAVRALARLGARNAATARRLAGLLLDPDADVRVEAAGALGRLKARAAVGALVNNLGHDPDGEARIAAATALGAIGAGEAVAPLVDCLLHDGYPQLDATEDDGEFRASWEVQARCLEALGEIGESATGASLHRGPRLGPIGDPGLLARDAQASAADAVIALLANDEYEHLQESGFRVLARLDGARARSFLLEQLRHGQRLARRRAARAVGELANGASLPRSPRLGQIGEPPRTSGRGNRTLLEGLRAALGDHDPDVRIHAARALGRLRDPANIAPLTRLLRDGDREVQQAAAAALAGMRGRALARHLHALLPDTDPKLRRAIVAILGEIADPASVRPLRELLTGADDNLRYAVVRAFESIGGKTGISASALTPILPALAALLDDPSRDAGLRLAAADALGNITPRSRANRKKTGPVLTALERAARDRHPGIAYAALKALVRIVPAMAHERLVALLSENRNRGRDSDSIETKSDIPSPVNGELTPDEAARAFGYAPDGEPANATLTSIAADNAAMPAMNQKNRGQSLDSDPDFSDSSLPCLAARLLGGLKSTGRRAVPALQAAFGTGDAELRCEVLLALGRLGDARALPTLLRGLAAPEPEIRLTAVDALGRLRGVKRKGIRGRDADLDSLLARLVQDDNPAVRERAVQALNRRGVRRLATRHWQRLLADEDISVCRAALNTLSKNRGRNHDSDPDFPTLVLDTMFRHSGELRLEAAAALRRLGRDAASARLASLLNDPQREEVHWICLDALAELHAGRPSRPGEGSGP